MRSLRTTPRNVRLFYSLLQRFSSASYRARNAWTRCYYTSIRRVSDRSGRIKDNAAGESSSIILPTSSVRELLIVIALVGVKTKKCPRRLSEREIIGICFWFPVSLLDFTCFRSIRVWIVFTRVFNGREHLDRQRYFYVEINISFGRQASGRVLYYTHAAVSIRYNNVRNSVYRSCSIRAHISIHSQRSGRDLWYRKKYYPVE